MADKGEGGGRDNNNIVTKLLQLANTPAKKRQNQIDDSLEAKNKKAHGSVRAEFRCADIDSTGGPMSNVLRFSPSVYGSLPRGG